MKNVLNTCSHVEQGFGSNKLSALNNLLACSGMRRFIQALSVLQYILSFLLLGPVCSVITIYLLSTDYWWITVLYITWLILDSNTHKKAGRRFLWMRRWAVWRCVRDYFPIRLIKTHDLPDNRNYILGYHPHGLFCFGAFCNFGTEATHFSEKFPGIKPYLATLSGNFRMPVAREYIMSYGLCPVVRETIEFHLSSNGTGNAVIIAVGGAAEALESNSDTNRLILRDRKGFVKLALKHGADLVPMYSFGENEVYKQKIFNETSWFKVLQRKIQKLLGFAICVVEGCGLFSPDSWGLLPFPKPITTVVGKPISVPKINEPSPEVVDEYHAMYITSLQNLFDQYKAQFGIEQKGTLVIQ